MKPIHITTSLVVAIIYLSTLSCVKEANKPTSTIIHSTHHKTDVVNSSSWFSANWKQGIIMQFIKDAPELNNNLLKGSKVLVFGKGGFEMRGATALPATFDANYIGVTAEVGNLRFVLEGASVISNSLQFKYILIPSEK